MLECDKVRQTVEEKKSRKVGKRDYLHFAFDRLAVGINTTGRRRDQ